MKPWIVLIIFASQTLLAACAATPNSAGRDFLGNVFPAECADLSNLNVSIIETRETEVILWDHGRGAGNRGGWLRPGVIAIAGGLDARTRAEAIEHELCHEKMYRLTGDPRWHD